jgi:aminoglycoside phosphotransferase (APT) family kinase protein
VSAVKPPTELVRHLSQHAGAYLNCQPPTEAAIRWLSSETRDRSHLHRFLVDGADRRLILLVKEPRWEAGRAADQTHASSHRRPRLSSAQEPGRRYRAEFSSLRLIEAGLGEDPRFFAVRALDFVESRSAIVMEEVRRPTLRELMRRHTRLDLRRRPERLDPVFTNAGAWLRAYHGLDASQATARHTQREELIGFVEALGAYLGGRTGWRGLVSEAVAMASRAATELLPPALPAGLHHGDYAMRNILVGERADVAVIDVGSIWRTCPLEDVGYFLVDLRTPRLEMLLQQLLFARSALDHWQQVFLSGYSSSTGDVAGLPQRAVALYQLITLLDSWTSKIDRLDAKPQSRFARALLERSYAREAERLLRTL